MSEQSKGSPTAAELRHRAEIARQEGQHGRSDALLAGAAAMERAERLERLLWQCVAEFDTLDDGYPLEAETVQGLRTRLRAALAKEGGA